MPTSSEKSEEPPNQFEQETIDWEVKKYSRLGAILVCILSMVVLTGWFLNLPFLKSILPGFSAMNPLEALVFVIASFSLILRTHFAFDRRTKTILALIFDLPIIIIGFVTLWGFLKGTNLGIDQLLFSDVLSGNRIAPNTGINFVLIGVSLLTLQRHSINIFRISQLSVLLAGIITIFAMVGYLYNVLALYTISQMFPMSLNTAAAFSVLCASIILSTPNASVVRIFIGHQRSSVLARNLFVFVLLFPIFIGYFILLGSQSGYYAYETGIALTVVVSIIILTAIVWLETKLLRQDEFQKEKYVSSLADRTMQLEQTQRNLNRKITELEDAREQIQKLLNHEEKLKEIIDN